MRIKEIEIDNFKSFKSKTTIPFLDGFTTISGPNGSGKSNIIDCILFGLGLSTSRTLRAEKLTDLINNTTGRREASVKIVFDTEIKEGNDLEIKRKIKEGTNGYTSTYYLNGRVSTLSEIHDNLSKYNVSPGCYNVMMQGDVTGIINMTPTERRKIIDELAGVTEFDRRIEHANREIETVQDRIERSNIILAEINTRLEQLSTEREHALRYQKLKDQKQTYINQISLVKYSELKRSLKLIQESINDSTKEKAETEDNLKALESKIIESKLVLDELNKKVKIKGEDEQIALTRQTETLKGEIFRQEQFIDFSQKQIEENKNSIEKAYKEINSLNETIDDTQLKIETKQSQYEIIDKQIEKESTDLKKLISESSNLSVTAQNFIEKRNRLRKDLEKFEDEYGRLNREKLKWEDIINRQKNELEDLKNDLSNSDNNKINLEETGKKLQKEIKEIDEEKAACEAVIKDTLNKIEFIKSKLTEVDLLINKNFRQLMQIEANKKAAEEINLGRAVENILTSNINGVHKTLAQLGKVDEAYSTAMEIAMGGRMKCIVVDDEHVASEAIRYLKQNKSGRATFLPLTKISGRAINKSLPDINGVVDYAINLIDFDYIYNDVFQYALGDTLIVEDIDTAKQLMGKFRMVTLDGSLVEKTGAMTGGSVQRNNLKFASDYNIEIKQYKERLKDLNSEKDLLMNDLSSLERKMEKSRQDYSNFLIQSHKKKLEYENIETSLNNIDSTLQHKENRVNELEPKINEAKIQAHSVEDELTEILNKIDSTKNEITLVDSSIPKEKLEQIEELTGNIEFEIKNLEAKQRNIETEIKKLSMEKEFKQQTLGCQQEKIDKCKTENEKLENGKYKVQTEIISMQTRVDGLSKEIKELSKELKEIQKERDAKAQDLFDIQKHLDQSKHNILRLEETLSSYNNRRRELTRNINDVKVELKEKDIDYTEAKDLNMTTEEINKSVERLNRKMESLEPVNMLAIKEYDEVNDRKFELAERITTLTNEKDELHQRLTGYEAMKKESFMTTFENVDKNFREIYSVLSDGFGRLILENEEDPFKGGLTIEAQPRGKKLLRLEAMSGGEKSLTALAFVFSFQKYLPAPFYAFDEVDMFLDGANVEKLAQMVREQASNAQFIVVSLRKPMIEKADRTIGVTQKKDGTSKVTGVKLYE